MKFSKLFGIVLFLHLGVIAIFILQPGCRTTQAPTRVSAADDFGSAHATATPGASARSDAPSQASTGRSAPRRPEGTAAPSGERTEVEDSGWDSDFGVAFNPQADDGARRSDDGPSIPVAGRSETIHVVESGDSLWAISRRYDASMSELLELNNLRRDSVLRVGQQIRVPREGGTVSPTFPSADRDQPRPMEVATTSYTVRSGDTLSRIASQQGTSVAAIRAANNLTSDLIRVGQVLAIPGGSGAGAAPSTRESAAPSPAPGPRSDARATSERIHVVRSGEFPSTIAAQYGMTANELLALNNITDPRRLQVGQELRVRGTAEPARAATPPAAQRTPAPAATPARVSPAPSRPGSPEPVRIRAVEADPLPNGAASDDVFDEDELFRDAVEIPVIPVRRD